jgi:putative ATP-dependent endonuclease of the OLD family
MKIKTIEVKNFKCIGPDPIKLDFSEDILVLVGENNVGKSSVLKALDIYFSGNKVPPDCFFNKESDRNHAVEISVTFDALSDGDRSHQAVTTNICDDGTWHLKKIYYTDEDGKPKVDHVSLVNGEEKRHPGGFNAISNDLFTNDKMQKIFVEAVKDVGEITTSKGTFGQIFNLLLSGPLEAHETYQDLLSSLEDYQNLFRNRPSLPEIEQAENSISQKLSRIMTATSSIDVDIPTKEKIIPYPKLLTNDGRDVDIDPKEQGHGLQRAIIFALLELLAETNSPVNKEMGPMNLLLIEEPEIYMHPQMERKIADTLYEIAASGKAQVTCTTHSPIFIRIADKHKSLARFIRSGPELVVKQVPEIFSEENKEDKKKQLRMISNFDPSVNEVFFAKRVVLVEGDTEIAVFREAAELLDNLFDTDEKKHRKRDTTFVNCRGKWTICNFQEVLNHFEIDYIVFHDEDQPSETPWQANKKILGLLGGDESRRSVFRDKIETVLGFTDSGKDKPVNALNHIQNLYENGNLEDVLGNAISFAYGLS